MQKETKIYKTKVLIRNNITPVSKTRTLPVVIFMIPLLSISLTLNADIYPNIQEEKIFNKLGWNESKDVIKNDFLVNDDTTGGCNQYFPSVAMCKNSYFVICWVDNSTISSDIYALIYDVRGNPMGSEFRVNDDAGINWQTNPSIGMDSFGNFVICWQDDRSGFTDIYAQRYDSLGNPIDSNFKVNDDAGMAGQFYPSIAIDVYGNFIICWMDSRNYNLDVYAQRYDASGNPIGSNFRVNDDEGTNMQYYPSAAIDINGNFILCWVDSRKGDWEIYIQIYDYTGNPVGSNFMINNTEVTALPPSIAVDSSRSFVVSWQDLQADDGDIYALKFDALGNPMGLIFKVNDDEGMNWQQYPTIVMGAGGNFMICWTDWRDNYEPDIYAQLYDTSGSPIGSNFRVNEDGETSMQLSPSASMDINGNFLICWIDWRNDNADIYVQRYDSLVNPVGSNFKWSEDQGTRSQEYPSVASNMCEKFMVCWQDDRNGNWDIYAQIYDTFGNFCGQNFKVNDDVGTKWQLSPSASMDYKGNFVVCWEDRRNNDLDIYAEIYDASGIPVGINFKVNNDTEIINHRFPSVAMDFNGNFVICWMGCSYNGYWDIYAQRYNSYGNSIGSNFKVNDDEGTNWQSYPSAAIDSTGNFMICWEDKRNHNYDIYAQMYDVLGNPLGSNFKINDDETWSSQKLPSVAMDCEGKFVICWVDCRSDYDIYAQTYDASGNPIGSNFRVNDDEGTNWQLSPSIAIDPYGERFLITWEDYRNPDGDPEIMAQKYENGVVVGENLQINASDSLPYNHQKSWRFCLDCNHNIIVFTWMDDRRHRGYDIYGKVTDWKLIGVADDNREQGIPILGVIVYPNPFSTKVIIELTTQDSESKNSQIFIYDLSGRLVKTMWNKGITRAKFTTEWDGRNNFGKKVPVGVYFLKVTAGEYTEIKKLLKMR